jgi:Cdc6-like AAA superfamily ATPase
MPDVTSSSEALFAPLRVSDSVASSVREFSDGERVTSWAIVRSILGRHAEYGNGMGGKLSSESGPSDGELRLVPEWVQAVVHLLDPVKVDILHGRLLIRALSHIDPPLETYLASFGFLELLEKELQEDFRSLLRPGDTPDILSYRAVLHADSPAREDLLGRKEFAGRLADWLTRFWNEEARQSEGHSFILHLHGPWGAGKTTLLRLLENELGTQSAVKSASGKQSGKHNVQWSVVWFNAWQHQHIELPWWSLMDTVYRQAVEGVTRCSRRARLRFLEWGWRFLGGHTLHLLALLASSITLSLLLILLVNAPAVGTAVPSPASPTSPATSPSPGSTRASPQTNPSSLTILGDAAKSLLGVFSVLGTIWSGTLLLSSSLLPSSTSSAQAFLRRTQDPMQKVQDHFKYLIERVDQPVIVLIDDLDRCRAEYAVRLLESIQTLFSHAHVFYVIAADRRWFTACFRKEYESFADRINEPGKDLGYLFLEKAIQLSVPVPRLRPEVQEQYLRYLLTRERLALHEDLKRYRKEAESEFQGVKSRQELFAKLTAPTTNPLQAQVRREVAVRHSARREIETGTKHFLQPFHSLIGSNPRLIKRLVNAYGMYQAMAILTVGALEEEQQKQLALWTIVTLRQGTPGTNLPEHLQPLTVHEGVKNVLNGTGVDVQLDKAALSTFLSFYYPY